MGAAWGVKKSAQNKRRYITYLLVRLPFPHLGKHFLYLEHQNSLKKLPVACKNINDIFSARPIIYPLYSIHRTRSFAHVLEEPISFLDFLANKASFEVRKQQQCQHSLDYYYLLETWKVNARGRKSWLKVVIVFLCHYGQLWRKNNKIYKSCCYTICILYILCSVYDICTVNHFDASPIYFLFMRCSWYLLQDLTKKVWHLIGLKQRYPFFPKCVKVTQCCKIKSISRLSCQRERPSKNELYKGPSINHVDHFLGIFDPLPPPCGQFYYIGFISKVDIL